MNESHLYYQNNIITLAHHGGYECYVILHYPILKCMLIIIPLCLKCITCKYFQYSFVFFKQYVVIHICLLNLKLIQVCKKARNVYKKRHSSIRPIDIH